MEVIREFKEEGKCGANSYVGATMNLSPEKQGTFIWKTLVKINHCLAERL